MSGERPTTAAAVIAALGLQRHPEGGWFAETWRGPGDPRATGTAIYYLLDEGELSHWHRLDVDEVWHHYAGGALVLHLVVDGGPTDDRRLGPDVERGERPQLVVPAGVWQSATPVDGWTLVGCTMAPGFTGEELAPPGWSPGDAGAR